MSLNLHAWQLVEQALRTTGRLRIVARDVEGGGRLIDCGIEAPGGIEAGVFLARLTLADLASVSVTPSDLGGTPCPRIVVATDHPIAACMASQYAGWQISVGNFFAMGSGPFRALYGKEDLYDDIGHRERTDMAIGCLETRSFPEREVFSYLADKLRVAPAKISLAVAPTASLAGSVQVVARSVETALHKLHAVGFDLGRVVSGFGSAPLPPPGKDDLASLGRTNDAVLYGARVNLWVRGDDESLDELGRRVPSSTSRDYGEPFVETFKRYDRDFYKIDPDLFSPAEITFHNSETGQSHHFGAQNLEVLRRSFYGAEG